MLIYLVVPEIIQSQECNRVSACLELHLQLPGDLYAM